MSPTVLAIKAPVELSSLPPNPALKWYMHYVSVFDADIHAAAKQPTQFYFSKAINYSADGSVIEGAKAIWEDYLFLWGSFTKLTRELRTIIFVSDEEKGTHPVHAEAVTVCHLMGGKGTVAVPTSFVYTLAKAEEGDGEGGCKFGRFAVILILRRLRRPSQGQSRRVTNQASTKMNKTRVSRSTYFKRSSLFEYT